jgi:hypothetical protein
MNNAKEQLDVQMAMDQTCEGDLMDAAKVARECAAECIKRLTAGPSAPRDCADIYPDFKSAVERLSNGSNTVLLDDVGMPSVMVRVDRMSLSSLIAGASDAAHPAFASGGKPLGSIYISKYQNIVCNGRAYSLPMQDPRTFNTFDEACGYCREKGRGWGITPFSLRAAVALWSRKNGTKPHGNNFSGTDYFNRDEAGIPTVDGRVATGSGPATWSHNGKPDGIYDMNGNLNEWDGGLRLMDGEIQIIPGADCILPQADLSEGSSQWRAILPDGSLAMPGTPGTLCYGGQDDKILLTALASANKPGTFNCAFQDIVADKGLAVPEIIKALMLYPEARDGSYGAEWRWIKSMGECLPLCGGAHRADDHAGIFFVGMTYPRNHCYELAGFRAAYVEPSVQ